MTETHWFRCDDADYDSPRAQILAFPVVRETPKGVWIRTQERRWYCDEKLKFVLRGSRKRWACPTVEEAKVSYHERKRAQVRILRARLANAEAHRDMGVDFEPHNLEACLKYHGLMPRVEGELLPVPALP